MLGEWERMVGSDYRRKEEVKVFIDPQLVLARTDFLLFLLSCVLTLKLCRP